MYKAADDGNILLNRTMIGLKEYNLVWNCIEEFSLNRTIIELKGRRPIRKGSRISLRYAKQRGSYGYPKLLVPEFVVNAQ